MIHRPNQILIGEAGMMKMNFSMIQKNLKKSSAVILNNVKFYPKVPFHKYANCVLISPTHLFLNFPIDNAFALAIHLFNLE